jgi:hypothetical protein
MAGYLPDLLGIQTVRDAAGIALPRRATLNIVNATVQDDPVARETVVTLKPVHVEAAFALTAPTTIVNVDADVYRVSSGTANLRGLGAPLNITGRQRVWILNHGSGPFILEHESASATDPLARFKTLTSADIIVTANQVVLAIRDSALGRWRVM